VRSVEKTVTRFEAGVAAPKPKDSAEASPPLQINATGSLALIDPKPFTRRLIAAMLAETFPDYSVLAIANPEELFDKLCKLEPTPPKFVLIYIRDDPFFDASIQRVLDLLNQKIRGVPIIFLSDHIDPIDLNKALALGVRGYIPTNIACDIAAAALKLIDAGGVYVPADVLCAERGKTHSERALDLTPRESSVLHLMSEGQPNKVIASNLKMQEGTVKVHVRNILKKLHVANRTQAVSLAAKLLAQAAE
jgi:DNA-binding NarL/FixJ family response regulator